MRYPIPLQAAVAVAAVTFSAPAHAPLAAQVPGTLVRIMTTGEPGRWSTGTVWSATADSIVIVRTRRHEADRPPARGPRWNDVPSLEASADTLGFARRDLQRMELSIGRKTNADRGALIGGGIVGALGLASGIAFCSDEFFECDGWEVPAAAAVGFAMGVLPGALIGALSHREHWARVNDPPPFSVSPSVMPDGNSPPRVTVAFTYRARPFLR